MGLMPYVRPKYLDDNSVLAVGYKLFFYAAGTTTKQNTFTDATLGVANPNPIVLNARGEPDNAGTPVDVYLTPGVAYKVVLATDTDIDPPNNPVWTVDNVVGDGGGGSGGSGQWESGTNATYLNDNTFLLVGVDFTIDYHQGRRVWLSGGQSRYGVISTSSYGVDTSVTLVDIQDASGNTGVIDPALATVSPSIQRVDGNKGIHYRFYPGTDTGVTNYEFPVGDMRRYGANMIGLDDNAAFVSCVAAVSPGSTLLVPDGVAVIQPMIISKEIHFIGRGTLELTPNGGGTLLTLGAGASGSTIQTITLDGNRVGQTTEQITLSVLAADVTLIAIKALNGLENIEITGASAKNVTVVDSETANSNSDGITVKNLANNVSIRNNTVKDGNYGIRVLGALEVSIDGNTVTGYALGGILSSFVTQTSDKVTIENNYISNKDIAATARGISIQSSNNSTITNNVIDKSKDIAITVERTATDPIPDGFIITENTLIEPIEAGIYIGEANFGIVHSNSIQTNGVSNYGIRAFGTGAGGITNTYIAQNLIGAVVTLDIENLGGASLNFTTLYLTADITIKVPSGSTKLTVLAAGGGGGGGGGGDFGAGGPGGNGLNGGDSTVTYISTDGTPITTIITATGGTGGGGGGDGGGNIGGALVSSFVTVDAVQLNATSFNGEAGLGSDAVGNPTNGGKGGEGAYGLGGLASLSPPQPGIDGGGGGGGQGQDGGGGGGGASTSYIHHTFDVSPNQDVVVVVGAGGVGGNPYTPPQDLGGDGGNGFVVLTFS